MATCQANSSLSSAVFWGVNDWLYHNDLHRWQYKNWGCERRGTRLKLSHFQTNVYFQVVLRLFLCICFIIYCRPFAWLLVRHTSPLLQQNTLIVCHCYAHSYTYLVYHSYTYLVYHSYTYLIYHSYTYLIYHSYTYLVYHSIPLLLKNDVLIPGRLAQTMANIVNRQTLWLF